MSTTETQPDATRTAGGHRHLGLALALISTAQVMVVLDATIVNIALPSMQRELHFTSQASLEWVINGYALAFGGLLLLGGRTGDLFGKRRMFMVGVAIFTLASFAGGLARDQSWLIIARVIQGMGGAIASPTALSLITSTFPEGSSRNRAMGVYAAMSGGGAALGLLLGGILTDVASWRWVLFVNVPIGLAVVASSRFVLGETATRRGRLDLPGAISATAGMSLLVYGLSHVADTSWTATGTLVSLAGAAVLLGTFLVIETRSPHALMPLRIFRNRNRSGSYAIMLIIGAAIFAMFFFLTQFVQNILGFSPLKAGVAFLPVSATIVVVAGISSRFVGRIGPRVPMTVGPLLMSGALFWLSRIDAHATYLGNILPAQLILAVGMGLTFVPLTLTAVSGVAPQEAGVASALLNTGQQLGGSLGLAVLVTVATSVTRGLLTPAAVTAGYARAFEIGGIFAFGAFCIALATIRVSRTDLPAEPPLPGG